MSIEPMHTFVVCAYGKSEHLEACIVSLTKQTVKSKLLIATATPSKYIDEIGARYEIPVHVNYGEAGITGDWNFALSLCETPFMTIAHQDDIYEPEYAARVLAAASKQKNPLLIFSDYYEIKNSERIDKSRVMKIKRMMNTGFRMFPRSKFIRRRVLSMGNSICCPSVTYSKAAYADFHFDAAYRFACDWDAWERIGQKKGAFVYVATPLMGHRIHEDSETSRIMADNRRVEEEYRMFRRYWPKFIAKRLLGAYAKNADNNQV